MKRKYKIPLVLILSLFIFVGVLPNIVSAESGTKTAKIENALIQAEDGTVISVNYNDYKIALRYETDLFDFLANTQGFMRMHGITSGDKYIEYNEYKMKLRYEAQGVVSDAINLSDPIPDSEIQNFHRLVINDDGTFTTEPIVPNVPEVDKTELAAKISEAEALNQAQYRQDTWEVLVQALETARQVNNDEDVTQEQVDGAYRALVDAMNALVIPTINATFRKVTFPPNSKFGFVITGVDGLPDAAKFSVEYRIKDKDENGNDIPVMEETDIVNIEGGEAGLVFYEPGIDPYNKINVKIYNEAEGFIWRFDNVLLDAPNKASYMSSQFEIHLTITN